MKNNIANGTYCKLPDGDIREHLTPILEKTEYNVQKDEVKYAHLWTYMGMNKDTITFYDNQAAFEGEDEDNKNPLKNISYEDFIEKVC